jgi:hypothetical protein
MATTTERLPILVTKEQKARIAKRAKAAQLTMGEFLRRAADSYRPQEDEALLERLIKQVEKSTVEANEALDQAISFVAASEKRIAQMEAARKGKVVS